MFGYIYLITNQVNGKVYVGQTVQTIEARWKQHIHASKIKNYPLYYAIRKYGIESFTIKELEKVSIECLNSREIYWISKYNSFGKEGYNATLGGDSGILTWTDSLYEDIKNMYLGGNTIKTIASLFNVDTSSIKNVLLGMNVKIKRQPFNINSYEKLKVIDEYNNGANLSYIAKEFSTDRETVKRTLIKWGVDIRKRHSFFEDENKVKELIDDFMSGMAFKQLENKYHTDMRKIKEVLAKHNIDFKKIRFKGGLTESQVLLLIKEYNKGDKTTRQLAKKYQINITTIYDILSYMNIDYRRYNITKSVQVNLN